MSDSAVYIDAQLAAGAAGYWSKVGELDTLVALVRAAAVAASASARLRVVDRPE